MIRDGHRAVPFLCPIGAKASSNLYESKSLPALPGESRDPGKLARRLPVWTPTYVGENGEEI
jgi:hypothetical protein